MLNSSIQWKIIKETPMAKSIHQAPITYPKTLIIGVNAPYNKTGYIESYFEEFKNLVKSSNTPYEDALFIKLREIDPAYFFTKGKREEIKALCDKLEIKQIVVSEPLSPQQARNLEDLLNVVVFDRTDLILDIFEQSAITAEGKTQVAIARFQHEKTRLAGQGKLLEQQPGVVGMRGGSGETQKEKEKRFIEDKIRRAKQSIEQMQKIRATQRKQRLAKEIPHFCLVGYTNAGKSTILNALTKSDVLAEDKLFATLDTTTRALFIDGKQKGVLLDTVGFIQQLPPKLIAAFKSTLSELHYADLLIQVIDLSDHNWESHIKVVHAILDDLEVAKPMLYVFNKADRVENLEALQPELERYQPHVIVSATSKNGLTPLINYLNNWQKK